MAQLFSRRATTIFRLLLACGVLALAGGVGLWLVYVRSGAFWNVGTPAEQPIPFRHDLHARALGLDCRFCHNTVERTASAGMPSAHTCLACHSQVWRGSDVLEPLRTSMALDQPVRWRSVHRLPEHSYFHHGAHIASGIGCVTCHGRVEEMVRTVKVHTMSMGWCLDCHRDAATRRGQLAWRSGTEPGGEATRTIAALHDRAQPRLTNCSTCHR